MKKRILSLLLVLCMVVGMLPASVFAADTTESTEITATADALIRMRADETAITAIEGKVGSWTPVSGYYYVSVTLQPGDGSYYFRTNDAGYVIDGTEADHTIEINYLGNAAKVILKGAAIANDHESFPALFLGTSKDNAGEGPDTAVGNQADYEIIVEGDSSITQSLGANSRAIYGCTVGTVTITSAYDARLTVSAKSIHTAFGYIHNRGDLFLKNANVFINGTTYGPKLYSRTGNVTIDGGDFNAVGTVYNGSTSKNYRGIYAAGNVTIQNGAEVNFYYPTGYVLYAENGEITIKDSAVALGSDYARLFNKEPNLVFADGAKTVALRQDSSPGSTVDATTGRVTVNPRGTVVEYDATTFATDYLAYRYFKVSPGNKGSGTVNLPSSDGSISYNVAAGADTKYFTVVDGLPVQITEQASFKDYKLKLEYPVTGVLTLTLNGAQLTTSGMNGIHIISSATCPIKIVTEADSTVIASKDTGGGGRAFFDSGAGMMTFTSENDATLTVSGMANSLNGYIQSKADILFENANIFADAYVGRDGGSYAVYALGNVTVKGGRFVHERVAKGTRAAAYGAIKGSNITFEDADVKVITQANTSVSAWDATPGYIFKADAAENPTITLKNTTLKAGITSNYGDGATGLFNVPPTLVYDVGCDAKGTADIAALDAEGNFKAMTNPVTLTSDDANAITYRHVEIAPHEHRYEDRVSRTLASAATCEHGDLYYVQCHNCEQISEKTIETTAPKAHTWTDATCTSGKVCSVCKKEFAYGNDPFYMVNQAGMGGNSSDAFSNVYGMPHFWADDNNVVKYNGESDVYKIAAMLKATFDAYPVGARYINFTLVARSFKSTYKNGIYMDEGVKITQDWLNEFLPAYKAIGGQLDGISIDLEFEYGRAEDLKKIYDGSHDAFTEEVDGKKVPVANDGIYKDIYFARDDDENLLFETTGMKQMMIDRGVEFDDDAADPLYIIHDSRSKAYAAYNEAFYILMNRYVDKAMEPLFKDEHYPDAQLTDYDRGYSEAWQGLGLNSGSGVAQGTANRVGNSSNMSLYMMDPSYLIFEYSWKPHGYNKGTFAATAFNAAKYNVERFKKMLAATPVEEDGSKNVSVWIAEYNFSVNTREAWTNNSPYYAEAILHLGLSNPSPFIGYVKPPVLKDENGAEYNDVETYNKYLAAVNSLMVELTLVAGTDDRTPIELPYSWNDDYILSGMKAGGRNIWRITPEDGLEGFLVWSENGTPTFRAGGQTIIFPQGRIVTTGNTIDYEYGTCGYWVETPEGVNPVVVSDADRYSAANGYTGAETKADLYVYDKYGYTVDKTVAHEGFTAYHVAWMNVDNTYKYLYVKNNGEKIREVLMAPGQDSFIVGEIESGSNLLTVEIVDVPDYVADDPYASDDFFWADATKPNHEYKYVDNGDGTHDYVCDCGEEGAVAIDNEAHEFDDENDTTCDKCGHERELTPIWSVDSVSTSGASVSLVLENEVYAELKFQFTGISGISKEELLQHIGLAVFYTKTDDVNDSTIDTADEIVRKVSYTSENDNFFTFRSNGINAKNMGDDRWYRVFVELPDGTVLYGPRAVTSPLRYSKSQVTKGDAEMKALCVAMMNYGTAAQNYFNYKVDTPMNAEFADYQNLVPAYDEAMLTERAERDKLPTFTYNNGAFSAMSASLTLAGAVDFNITVTNKMAGTVTDAGVLIWDQKTYQSIEEVTLENATVLQADPKTIVASGDYTKFEVINPGVAAKNYGDTLFFVPYFTIDGTTYYANIQRTSVEYYAKTQIDKNVDSKLVSLMKALVVYGDCAREYFY